MGAPVLRRPQVRTTSRLPSTRIAALVGPLAGDRGLTLT